MGEATAVKAVPAIRLSRRVSLFDAAMCRVRIQLDNCTRRTWAMPDTLARCIVLETVRVAEGLPVSARTPATKQMVVGIGQAGRAIASPRGARAAAGGAR